MENTPNNIPSKQRLLSLDVLRGLTVAGMILVNNGGGKFHTNLCGTLPGMAYRWPIWYFLSFYLW